MFFIKEDMNIRISEVDALLSLIESIESGNFISQTNITMTTPVLRASVVLALYNIIESTITKLLTKIHEEINKRRVNYNNLSPELRELTLIHFYKHKQKHSDIHASKDVLLETVELIRGKGFFQLSYADMSESYQLYSGNLDAKIIRKIMTKYGILIPEGVGQCLKAIKDGRNMLAHGEVSFEEFGRTKVLRVIKEYFDDVKSFLNIIISIVTVYINEQKYKKNIKRKK